MTKNKIQAFILMLIMCVTLCACQEFGDYLESDLSSDKLNQDDGKLVSHFIDVGQGDSEFIELPGGKCILIDAGDNEHGQKVVDYIKDLGYEKIDYLIATHPHSDHIGGMRKVVNAFELEKIYMPKAETNTYTYEKLLKAIKNKGKKITTARSGMNMIDDKDHDLKADILAPAGSNYESLNNYSVVLRLSYKKNTFLYMGDAELLSENQIIKKGYDLSADVVKVGHHCSSSSSGQGFIDKTGAKYAVISLAKDNDYHHPHKQPLNRWKKSGAEILRTDQKGTITIESTGQDLKVTTEKGNSK